MARSHTIFGRPCERVTLMSYRIFAVIGLCAWLIGWTAPSGAHAAEQIIVPFTCETDAGGVYARPSQPQSYAIIGQREAAPFTACASDGSDRCRTMMLHRFNINCDGQRIAWPEFYSAISDATTGRAFVEGDRLLVRVRPQRTRRSAQSRFRPPPSRRTFLVEMPDGFAPLRGTVARFKGGRSARNAPMRATRDPFTSPPPQQPRTAPTRRPAAPPTNVARTPPKTAPVKPKRQPTAKPARRNIIAVPQNEPSSKAQSDKPTVKKPSVAKPTIAATSTPQPSVKSLSKPKSPPPKVRPRFKVVEAPSAQPKPVPVAKAETKTENKAAASAPTVIPELLNGPKETPAGNATSAKKDFGDKKEVETKQPDSIADLLQDRGALLRAEAKTADAQADPPFGMRPAAPASVDPIASPTLANTLAVLGIVSSLMFAFAYAAHRFLIPKPTPPRAPAHPMRPVKRHVQDTQPVATTEPSLSAMAQTSVTKKAEEKSDQQPSAIQNVSDKTHTVSAPEKAPPSLSIAIPKHPAPTLDTPAVHEPDLVASQPASAATLTADKRSQKNRTDILSRPCGLYTCI